MPKRRPSNMGHFQALDIPYLASSVGQRHWVACLVLQGQAFSHRAREITPRAAGPCGVWTRVDAITRAALLTIYDTNYIGHFENFGAGIRSGSERQKRVRVPTAPSRVRVTRQTHDTKRRISN
jgi:hypothetical protein